MIGGKEFQVLTSFLTSLGIIHKTSFPYIHKQNGLIERKHKHIVKLCLSMLAYWDESLFSCIHLINRLSTPILFDK